MSVRKFNPYMRRDDVTVIKSLMTPKKRLAIGEEKKDRAKTESKMGSELEKLLRLHRLDFWHCTVAQWSQAGFPDYVIFGDSWLAFLELKARSEKTGRPGVVSEAQKRYKASIEAAGSEWVTFLLPDEWDAVDVWLNAKTHKDIWGFGGIKAMR